MSDIARIEKEGDVAIVVIDNPPVNTITAEMRASLTKVIAELKADGSAKAVVLLGEGKHFCSGADLDEFNGEPKEAEYRALFGEIEQLNIPVVAAMHGIVMGGGLEMCLACHYRVTAPGTKLGLPEVSLGIIPGAGGTQRMPRLIGSKATLEMIFNIAPVTAGKAIELGFVDAQLEDDRRTSAVNFARQLLADGKGPRRTCDMEVLPDTATAEIFDEFRQLATNKFRCREAPLTAIKAVAAAAEMPFEEGLLYEDELVNGAKDTTESEALIHLFFADRETLKLSDIASHVTGRPVNRVAIIGAGTMGAGIAMCFANAGINVELIDVNEEGLQRGLDTIENSYDSRVKRGRITEEDKVLVMALIRGATSISAAAEADMVIEAVYENMELKKAIFREIESVTRPGTILGTNTSTLDINEIANAISRPEDVVGLHFFTPAHVMPLLEVIRTDSTSDEVLCTSMNIAKKIRKTPVLARVCYGFIGNRMMEGYAREAELMVLEGARPRTVDSTLENDFGMAMGILAVFDMAGVDVGTNVHIANADKYPPDPTYYQADFALVDAGRLGQKNGKGYYRYKKGDRNRYDDDAVFDILRTRAKDLGIPQRDDHATEEIIERCLFPLINEGIRVLEEGIASRAADIDVVWTSG